MTGDTEQHSLEMQLLWGLHYADARVLLMGRCAHLQAAVGELAMLEVLSVGQNQLQMLPPSIGGLSRLTRMYLHKNNLSELPAELARLSSLVYLSVHENKLSELPAELGDLAALGQLYAHGNELHDLPRSLCAIPRLKLLAVDDCVMVEAAPTMRLLRQNGCRIKSHTTVEGAMGKEQLHRERQTRHIQRQREMASAVLARAAPTVGVGVSAAVPVPVPSSSALLEPYSLPPLPPSPSSESD